VFISIFTIIYIKHKSLISGSQNLGIPGYELALEDGSRITDPEILNSLTDGTLLILLEKKSRM
jgi:hypothetical protein